MPGGRAAWCWMVVSGAIMLIAAPIPSDGFISSIEPRKGSLAGGTVLTIHGGGLISNDTTQ